MKMEEAIQNEWLVSNKGEDEGGILKGMEEIMKCREYGIKDQERDSWHLCFGEICYAEIGILHL